MRLEKECVQESVDIQSTYQNQNPPSKKQMDWLMDLVCRHPNFRQTFEFVDILFDKNKVHQLRDEDGETICTRDEAIVSWLNQKYGKYLPIELTTLTDLDKDTVSALIAHFKLGEQERSL